MRNLTRTQRSMRRMTNEIAPRVIDGETQYFVGDPLKKEYKQLDDLQYTIFERLNGQVTLAEIAADLKAEFDLDASAEDLGTFVDNLQEMNLLDLASDTRLDRVKGREISAKVLRRLATDGVRFVVRGDGGSAPPRKHERRTNRGDARMLDGALACLELGDVPGAAVYLRSILRTNPRNHRARYLLTALMAEHVGERKNIESLWWWRFPLYNPDRFLGRLDKLIGNLVYSKGMLVLYPMMVAVAGLLLFSDLDTFTRSVDAILAFRWIYEQPWTFALAWVVGPLAIYGHEMSHGLACKHFGGRVREAGILFSYMTPAAYCDISSTYLMENRLHRVLVSLAGPLYTWFLWCGFVFVWSAVDPSTPLGLVCALNIAMMGVTSFTSDLNPLVKSDGYYALTDLLNAPNLRDDAFAYLRLRVRGLVLGISVDVPEDLERRKRLFLWYAIPGMVGTGIFMSVVLWALGTMLIERFHTVGALIVGFILWGAVGKYIKFAIISAWQERAVLAASRRFRAVAAVTVVFFAAVAAVPLPLRVQAVAHVAPEVGSVRARAQGIIHTVLVADGDRVEKGQPVVVLDRAAAEADVARAQSDLEQAQSELERLRAGARVEDVDVAETRLRSSLSTLRGSESRLRRLRDLVARGLVPQTVIDELAAQRANAETRVSTSRKDLALVEASARSAEIAAAEALIEGTLAELIAAKRRFEDATLRSPAAGVVLLITAPRPEDMQGLFVEPGQELAQVRSADALKISIDVPITAPVSVLASGAYVKAVLVGAPDVMLEGRLTKISASFASDGKATSTAETRTILAEATMSVADDARSLPIGLTGVARIDGGLHPFAWHIYARVVRLMQIDLQRLIG